MIIAFQLLIGLVLLTVGGELLVRGSVAIATRLNVSKLVIGLTLVGFGTSTPELLTSLNAALVGAPGIAIGNVVGSNICNILLILGLASIISPMVAPWASYKRDCLIMIGASLLLLAVCIAGELTRTAGAVLFTALIAYIWGTFYLARRDAKLAAQIESQEEATVQTHGPVWIQLALTLGGLGLLMIGASQLVTGSIALAEIAGVPETIIGLTIVAVGTSLPELVTSVMAALKKHADVAIGNIIGSNIFNILGILGLTAVVKPITIPLTIMTLDIWVMLGAAILLIALIAFIHKISRPVGAGMLAFYAGYVVYLIAHTA